MSISVIKLFGLLIVQTAKAWFIDRMVLLFEDMKTRNPEYAGWEH